MHSTQQECSQVARDLALKTLKFYRCFLNYVYKCVQNGLINTLQDTHLKVSLV